jgi:hypothetical protein
MEWVAVMFVGFLILGLRRTPTRINGSVAVIVIVAAAATVWYAQLATR